MRLGIGERLMRLLTSHERDSAQEEIVGVLYRLAKNDFAWFFEWVNREGALARGKMLADDEATRNESGFARAVLMACV